MPAFGDTQTLTQAQIADIEVYILRLNGVNRDKILNPGVEPKKFFYLVIGVSSLMAILFRGARPRDPKSKIDKSL